MWSKNWLRLKGKLVKSTIRVGDFNTLLSTIYRITRQKIGKDIEELNTTINKQAIINVYRTFHPTADNSFFSSAHGIYTKIDHILGHQTKLNKLKRSEVIQNMSVYHNGIKLEMNHRKITRKSPNPWKPNNSSKYSLCQRSLKEIKVFIRLSENKNATCQIL